MGRGPGAGCISVQVVDNGMGMRMVPPGHDEKDDTLQYALLQITPHAQCWDAHRY
jgi:hypothetical protein